MLFNGIRHIYLSIVNNKKPNSNHIKGKNNIYMSHANLGFLNTFGTKGPKWIFIYLSLCLFLSPTLLLSSDSCFLSSLCIGLISFSHNFKADRSLYSYRTSTLYIAVSGKSFCKTCLFPATIPQGN